MKREIQRNFIGGVILSGVIATGIIATIAHDNETRKKGLVDTVLTARVTEGIDLDGTNDSEIFYMGMPTERTFSLVPNWVRASVNAYYSIDTKNILCENYEFNVLEVTPDHIKLQYKGEKKEPYVYDLYQDN